MNREHKIGDKVEVGGIVFTKIGDYPFPMVDARPAPKNERPYWPAHLGGEERITHTMTSRQTWRQIGWHGQSGAFYGLDEDPSAHERGSFSPLWLLVNDEPPLVDRYTEGQRS